MTVEIFLDELGVIAASSKGTSSIRQKIIDLAVRGKLVAQDASDEPASVLLERIAAEKARLVAEKKIRKPKALPPIEEEEVPFEVPEGWEWCRLGSTSNRIHYGYTASADHQNRANRFLRITDIQNNHVEWNEVPGCSISAEKLDQYALSDGDIVIARTGGTVGKTYLVSGMGGLRVVFASYLIRVAIPEEASNSYLKLALESPLYWSQLIDKAKGTGQPNVNATALSELRLPIPPLAEQHRIVAKVDALMGLLDRLESAREARDGTRTSLRDSALSALADAEDAASVETAWTRMSAQMDELFTDPSDVAPLRQTILQLAVRGRLVPQDASDEPARVLLERIAAEKARLVAEKKIRKPKALPPIEADEVPFAVPEGWEWARLQDIGDWGAGATPKRGESRFYGGETNWFKSGELPNGPMKLPSVETVTDAALAECSLRLNQPGDVLIAMYGATIGKLGILHVPGTTNQAVCACTCHTDFYNRYLFTVLSAWKERFIGRGEGGAQPNISKVKITSTAAPIPPLAEQHRIVAKVDALMALCDDLEAHLMVMKKEKDALAATNYW